MMNENSNVDRLFRDGLRDYEESFPSYVWDNIAEQLDQQKKQRTIFYLRSLAASIVVLLAFGAGYFFTQSPHPKTNALALKTTNSIETRVSKSLPENPKAENVVLTSPLATSRLKVKKRIASSMPLEIVSSPQEEQKELKEQTQPLIMSVITQPEYASSEKRESRPPIELKEELRSTDLILKTDSLHSLSRIIKEEKQVAPKENKPNFFARLKNLFKK